MQITFFSEDFKEGITRDWPVVPRVGEVVQFSFRGGVAALVVQQVLYFANADGNYHSTQVTLIYPEADTYMLHDMRATS